MSARPALKHLLGSAKAMIGRLIALVAITAASFGIFAGGLSAIDSNLSARDQWFEQGRRADLEVLFQTAPSAQVPDFSTVDGVESVRTRLAVLGSVDVADHPHLALKLVAGRCDDEVDINKLVLLEGAFLDPGDTKGILIDRHLQESHEVQVGDELPITVGVQKLSLIVRGVVQDSEYLLAPANPSLFVPTKGTLGVGFVVAATLEELNGVGSINSVLVRLSPGVDREQTRNGLLAQAQRAHLELAHVLGPDEQFASLYLEKNLAVFTVVVPVIVVATGLSSVFVTFFLLAQWLARERRAFGVLMTLGYRPAHLVRAFMVVLALLAGVSMAVGIGLAYLLASLFVWRFGVSVGLPLVPTVLTGTYLWTGCAAIALMFISAGIYSTVQVASMTPLDAIRTVPGLTARPGRISGWLGSRLPTSWLRIALRNTARDKVVSVLTVVSMALGFGITASFFVTFTSVITTAHSYVLVSTWDLLADFRTPQKAEDYTSLAQDCGAGDATGEVKGVVQATAGSIHANLYVGGFDPEKLWHVLPNMISGHDVRTDDPQGILLEVATARELGVDLGDVIDLDSTVGHFEAHIVGIFSGVLPGESRFPVAYAQDVLGLKEHYSGMLVRVALDQLDEVKDCFANDESVQQVLTRAEIESDITTLSNQIITILHLGSAVSIVVALLFVIACLGYTVFKRAPDYQLLRSLGFRDRVVVATIVTETYILGFLAIILAIPVGFLTAQFTGWQISKVWFHINTSFRFDDFAQTFLPALILLPGVALLMARTVLREPLDTFMRSRELG